MRKITANTKIELTEKEVKLINDIWNFWVTLDNEFSDDNEINCDEFADFLNDVASGYDYTVLNEEKVEIVRVKDNNNNNKNHYKSNTEEEKEAYNRGYENGYEVGYNDGYDIGQNDHPIRSNY